MKLTIVVFFMFMSSFTVAEDSISMTILIGDDIIKRDLQEQIEDMFGLRVKSVEISPSENPINYAANLTGLMAKEVHIQTQEGVTFNCGLYADYQSAGLSNCQVWNKKNLGGLQKSLVYQ